MAISTPTLIHGRFEVANDTGLVHPTGTPAAPTGTVTFTNGRLYLYFFGCHRTGAAPDLSTGFSFSHGGTARTWNYIGDGDFNGGLATFGAYWRIAGETESVYLLFDTPGGNNSHNSGHIVEIASGFDTTTPIAQFKVGTAAAALSLSIALDAAPNAANLSIAGFKMMDSTTGLQSPRTNWTELNEVSGTGTSSDSGSSQVQYKTDLSTEQTASSSVASTNRDWAGIHLEIAAAAAAVDRPPLPTIIQRQTVDRSFSW